ncbi:MAG: prepilin-type N-terminal cleavage/methylation domain-containing protein [Desulfobacterales bacterium]|nr:prepilin-type N-terminal cleavage/methylation domain-containing protein [Desulfobacterales bacterium]
MKNNRFVKEVSGFTLVELLTVICILSIVLMIAIPNFIQWQANYRFRNAIIDLYSNFQRARSAAMRHRCLGTVTFHQPIPPESSEIYDYAVFIDKNNDMMLDLDEMVIAKVKWSEYINVEFGSQCSDGVNFSHNDLGFPAVAFRSNGLPINNKGGLGMGSVFIKNTNNNVIRSIKLASAGRVRIAN